MTEEGSTGAPDCTMGKKKHAIILKTSSHRDPVGLTEAVFDVSTMLFLRP